jgi:erythromycin esterase-like protein
MIDPYGIKQGDTAWDIGNYANTWEVTVLPTVDKSKEYAALYPQLRGLLEGLKHVQPREMSHEQRLAFWINIYHSLILHAHLLFGVPKTHYKRINFMNKVQYRCPLEFLFPQLIYFVVLYGVLLYFTACAI